MKTFDPYSPDFNPDDEQFVREVMASFSCSNEMAHKIIKSSELNGQLDSIKNFCQNNRAQRKGNR